MKMSYWNWTKQKEKDNSNSIGLVSGLTPIRFAAGVTPYAGAAAWWGCWGRSRVQNFQVEKEKMSWKI